MSLTKLTVPALSLILLILTLGSLSSLKTSIPDPIPSEPDTSFFSHSSYVRSYDQFIKKQLDSLNNTGAATVIVKDDSVVFIKAYGVKKAGSNDSVDIHTVFRLASVSKGFSGVLMAILNKEGYLTYTETVKSILPDFELKDPANTDSLNILHLLSHTSGLVPHTFDNLIEAEIEMKEIIKRLHEVDITSKPGYIYGYQNTLFSLVDTISAVKTGMNFDILLNEKIFSPLGMTNSSSGLDGMIISKNIAYPHRRSRGEYVVIDLDNKYYNALPAAGINSSIADIGVWLKAMMGNRPDILDTNLLEEVINPQIYTPLKRSYTRFWPKLEGRYYGLGWRLYYLNGQKIVYHGGYVRGYRAEIAFCPEEKIGIAFLQNSPNRVSAQSIPYFFERYFEENRLAKNNNNTN